MYDIKRVIITVSLMTTIIFTSCMGVEKIEKQTEISNEKADQKRVSEVTFETKGISEIRDYAEKSMSVLGTDNSEFSNIGQTDIIPIITGKDWIYNIQLKKMDGNELTNNRGFSDALASKHITNTYDVYRNDKEKIKKKLNIPNGTDIEDLIAFAENYLNTTYKDSIFEWFVEYVTVHTSTEQKDFIVVSVRPSYDGVVFTGRFVLNNGIPTNTAKDFRGGHLCITEMNKIDEYHEISPNYEVEKQGEAIGEILSIESVLSIVANKIDKESVSEIKLFELAYRLNKDLTAVPIWNIVVHENGNDRNFQIDAVTGDVYFE